MSIGLIVIIVLVIGAGFLTFFIVKSALVPQRVGALEGLIKKGKTQTAIKAAKRIIQKDSHSTEAHYHLGMAYLAEKRDELAIMELKLVNQLGISGKDIPELEFRHNLAQLFARQNQTEEALKEYLLLIKLVPNKGDYYYEAGKLFASRGKRDVAENYLAKAAELSPKDGKIHYELGLMFYHAKKMREAKAAFQVALKQSGVNAAEIHFYLGKMKKDSKEFNEALSEFEKAARDAQIRIKALVERGGCYMAMGAMEKAVPDLERAVNSITDEAAQDSLYARYFLGACYEAARDIGKAVEQWEKIHSQKKNFRDVGEKLSQYHDVSADDNIKDYMSAAADEFLELCKTITMRTLDLQIKEIKSINEGCEVKAIENESAKWRNTRKMPRLMRFYRSPNVLDEEKVRSILEDAKAENIVKTAIFSSSDFSAKAIEYASSRSVELCNSEKIAELVKKANSAAPAKAARR